jgi:hypothetical protein
MIGGLHERVSDELDTLVAQFGEGAGAGLVAGMKAKCVLRGP